LSGKDKIRYSNTTNNTVSYISTLDTEAIYLKASGTTQFYVYNATTIAVDSSKKFTSSNLTDNKIITPDHIQKISITVPSDTAIEIHTDGTIYAAYIDSYITDNALYTANGIPSLTDYMIEVLSTNIEYTIKNVKLIIDNAEQTYYDINQITIKESRYTS
jgi:hypothetical protein